MAQLSTRRAWKTRFGIYLAAIGSAFGLGSLWRFPYIVAENGGGAFVMLYLFLVVIMGLPLLVGELLIGKITRRGVLGAQRQLMAQAQSSGATHPQRRRPLIRLMPMVGAISTLCCVCILGYYVVISGWVLYFLARFMAIPFLGLSTAAEQTDYIIQSFTHLHDSGGLQLSLGLVHLTAIVIVVAKEVEDGIERWVGFIMPIFVGILAVLLFKSLSMSSSGDALRYFMYPDFSKLNINSLGYAVGQFCFTLSIGFATMVTFGSYLHDDSMVPQTGFRVAFLDSLTAIIAGLMIFPLVIGGAAHARGPELLFQTVPEFLTKLEGGYIFGIFFFVCLYLAALGASISLLETIASNVCENSRLPRGRASFYAGIGVAFVAIVPAFSSSVLRSVTWHGRGVLELIDLVLINGVVPLMALLFCLIVVYEVNPKLKRDEFLAMTGPSSEVLYNHWSFLMKWVVPPLITVAFILQIVGLFKK
jgi:neurotransmitter:Na+ symporter, NSS family